MKVYLSTIPCRSLHLLGSEASIGTILIKRTELHIMAIGTPQTHKCVVTRQVPGQQFRERATQTAIAGFSFDVLIPPSGQCRRREAGCIEPITMIESDGIAESGFYQCWRGTVCRVHKWVTYLTDNLGVFQVFGKPGVTYPNLCESTLQNQPKYLAIAKQVSIDTAMQYCEVRMGGLTILHHLSSVESVDNAAVHRIGFATRWGTGVRTCDASMSSGTTRLGLTALKHRIKTTSSSLLHAREVMVA